MRLILLLFLLAYSVKDVFGFVEGLYCGVENCYDVLGLTREATKTEIQKAYRKLASKFHPDRVRGSQKAKDESAKKFQVIATAYETLKDEEARNDYDYMLDNPEELYRHYYYYYKRRVAPKVDVRIVIVVTILLISIVQYISARTKYSEAMDYLMTESRYRNKAYEIAQERGLLGDTKTAKRGKKRSEKEEIKAQEEQILRKILEENMDIKGGYSRPSITSVLLIQILMLPVTIFQFAAFYVRWFWKYTVKREDYGEEEKLYLIRKYMKMSQAQFDSQPENQIADFLRRELWMKENFEPWKVRKELEEKQKMAESGAHKRYRRYMKAGGAGQMTFMED